MSETKVAGDVPVVCPRSLRKCTNSQAPKNWTSDPHAKGEHGIHYKKEAQAGVEYTGAPASSGEESQTIGGKFKDPSAPAIEEAVGKTEGSLAEESKSFGH